MTDRLVDQAERLAEARHIAPSGPVVRIPAGDLRALRDHLCEGDDVVLIDGRSVLHAPALRAVIGDDRISSGLLVARGEGGDSRWPVKLDRDARVVVSVGSPLHEPVTAGASSVGVLRLDGHAAREAAQALQAAAETLEVSADASRAVTTGRDATTLAQAPVEAVAAAAVAAGVRLRPIELRGMQASRPDGPGAAVHALRRCEDRDEDRAWLDAAVKAKDGWFTTFFVSPYSRFVARWAAGAGLSPNQVTTLSALVGLAAAVAFAVGSLPAAIVGAVTLQIAFMLDCVDGQLSRYTQRFSTFGAWLDSMLDRGKELLVYLGLAIGGLRAGEADIWLLAVASAALLVLRHSIDLAFEAARPAPELEPAPLRQGPDRDAPAVHLDGPETTVPAAPTGSGLRGLARSRPVGWLARILSFPIGERFAAISLLSVFATRRTTFLVLLVWGLIAWAASIALKLLRSRRWPSSKVGWLLAATPRLLEYGAIVGVAIAVPDVRPAAFALILALGLRHYDEGYRARTLGDGRTDATTRIVLGAWHVRAALLVLAALLGLAVPVAWALTFVVGVLGAVDLVRAWLPTTFPDGSPR